MFVFDIYAPWRSLGSQAPAQSRRWDKTVIQWQCLGRTGEERCIPGTASWSSSFANLGGHVSFPLRSPCPSGHLLHDVKPGIASGRAERSTGWHRPPACRKAVSGRGGRMWSGSRECESRRSIRLRLSSGIGWDGNSFIEPSNSVSANLCFAGFPSGRLSREPNRYYRPWQGKLQGAPGPTGDRLRPGGANPRREAATGRNPTHVPGLWSAAVASGLLLLWQAELQAIKRRRAMRDIRNLGSYDNSTRNPSARTLR
jgi:hypothetical protein